MPDHVKERLARVVAELGACRADVRWVHADSMHLTLKFLGNVDTRDLGAIDEALKRVAGAAQPARGRLCDVGSFPHMSRPRVLWAGVQSDGEALANLAAATDAAMSELGFPPERRRFHAHVTIGRVRGGRQLDTLREAVGRQAGFGSDPFAIDSITLFESELRRSGARYTPIAVYRLR
jgi:2'-5' RNA ligase